MPMATTAPAISAFDTSIAVDPMDLHSDNNFENDGDVDLDLGSVTGMPQDDDALSMQDAGNDGGIDLQTVTADYDDFMVDKDDLIEEDEIDYGDLELEDAGQEPTNGPDDTQESKMGQDDALINLELQADEDDIKNVEEEDLIDYSDEDEQPQGDYDSGFEAQGTPGDDQFVAGDETEPILTGYVPEADNKSTPKAHDGGHDRESKAEAHDEAAGGLLNDGGETDLERYTEIEQQELAYVADNQDGTDGNHTNSPHAAPSENEKLTNMEQSDRADAQDQTRQLDESEPNQAEQHREAKQGSFLPPVTINYDGTEFWLFKPDHAEDGEWLLEDVSVATQPIHHLFHACRSQLGDDINSETELGLRFDHFHAMELYEDCTACAITCLKDLVDIYVGLSAQDGNHNPDSFYITLQFRPRVLSLVNELKKAVQDQIGFSGLNRAIASGQSNFNNAYMNDPSEGVVEPWDGGEQDGNNAQLEAETKGQEGEYNNASDEDSSHRSEHHSEDDDVSHTGNTSVDDGAPLGEEGDLERNTAQDEGSSHQQETRTDEEEQESGIEYSDDEGIADAVQPESASVHDPSSSSSTVEGDAASDAPADVTQSTNPPESREDDGQSYYSQEDVQGEFDEQFHADAGNENPYAQYDEVADGDAASLSEEVFERAYEEGDDHDNTVEGVAIEDFGADEFIQNDGDYYNDENADVGFNLDEDFGLAGAIDGDAALGLGDGTTQAAVDAGTTDVDAFLDLTGASGDVGTEDFASGLLNAEVQEEIDYDDEEDAAGPGQADTSTMASSVGLENNSPLGQKRAIDEVDAEHGDGSDTTDPKRPKI